MAKPEKDNKMAIQNEGMALIHCQIQNSSRTNKSENCVAVNLSGSNL